MFVPNPDLQIFESYVYLGHTCYTTPLSLLFERSGEREMLNDYVVAASGSI